MLSAGDECEGGQVGDRHGDPEGEGGQRGKREHRVEAQDEQEDGDLRWRQRARSNPSTLRLHLLPLYPWPLRIPYVLQ